MSRRVSQIHDNSLRSVAVRLHNLFSYAVACLPLLIVTASCEEEFGADHCEEPGSSEKCTCPGGRVSARTCDAFNTYGACYCNTTGCGNGEVEAGEQCDDGNLDSGDGCDDNCLIEVQPNGGFGGTPVGPGGFGGTPVGPGGFGGMPVGPGGFGGFGGAGGAGGIGGAGGN
jgi:cysteine-rich repeat protein